jgi:hypothetical protein
MAQMPLVDDPLRRRNSLISSCWSTNQDEEDDAYKIFKDFAQRSKQWFCGGRGNCCVIQVDPARVIALELASSVSPPS